MTRLLLLDLVLQEFSLNLEVTELLSQALGFDTHPLSLLFTLLDLLFHHDAPLNCLVVLGLHVL